MTPRAPEKGFSYIEVLAAMCMVAFVVVGSMQLLIGSMRVNTAARDQTIATTLAQDLAETLRRTHYANLRDGDDVVKVRGLTFERHWRMENDVPYPHMRRMTVTVSPQRRSGHGGVRTAEIRFVRVPA